MEGNGSPSRDRRGEEVLREAYDRLPYPSASHHHTHPDHLATLALLHGMEPPPLETCRVLELGCADGANLLPMAYELPRARFVGIDLSPLQVEAGRRRIEELEILNLELRAMSLLDVDAGFGSFDYVIAHGLFSWVPEAAQEKILEICRRNLAPNGVAYLSYNTFPGWHTGMMVREMLLYHTRDSRDPEEITARSIDLLRFLAEANTGQEDEHALALRSAWERLQHLQDRPSYFLHDFLEEENRPLYFHQMVERAARHGLQYMTDAEPDSTELSNLPPALAGQLQEMAADRIELEQYLDFVRSCRFRRSLLCHQEVRLDRTMVPRRMKRLWAASPVKPASTTPDLAPGTPETFHPPAGRAFSTGHPLVKAALVSLGAIWPRALAFDDLLRDVRTRMAEAGAPPAGDDPKDVEVLADILHSLFFSGQVELHLMPPACVETVSERPLASPLARYEAERGSLVTNQRHRVLDLRDDVTRFLLVHLDGRNDRAALVHLLDEEAREERLRLTYKGELVPREQVPAYLGHLVEEQLHKMAENALLAG
ncbi:MAG TPA: class I SAM-dependent methyltransferase [Thermoanaerobaculia bacterium]